MYARNFTGAAAAAEEQDIIRFDRAAVAITEDNFLPMKDLPAPPLGHLPRQRSVCFVEEDHLHEVEKMTHQDFPDLWYTRSDFYDFRAQASRQADILRTAKEDIKNQEEKEDCYENHPTSQHWYKSLLEDYQACRRAGRAERLSSPLFLDPKLVNGQTIGLEVIAVQEIARDLAARRNHLLNQIFSTQEDLSLPEGDRISRIFQASRSCSRSARLFAQHVAAMAAPY